MEKRPRRGRTDKLCSGDLPMDRYFRLEPGYRLLYEWWVTDGAWYGDEEADWPEDEEIAWQRGVRGKVAPEPDTVNVYDLDIPE